MEWVKEANSSWARGSGFIPETWEGDGTTGSGVHRVQGAQGNLLAERREKPLNPYPEPPAALTQRQVGWVAADENADMKLNGSIPRLSADCRTRFTWVLARGTVTIPNSFRTTSAQQIEALSVSGHELVNGGPRCAAVLLEQDVGSTLGAL